MKTPTTCAAGALLLALTTAACAAPAATPQAVPLPGSGGAWVYDGRVPPACDTGDIRVRRFAGDVRPDVNEGHAHLGHGHRWSKRDHKGRPTRPPCYVRRPDARPAARSALPVAGRTAATRNVLSGDLS